MFQQMLFPNADQGKQSSNQGNDSPDTSRPDWWKQEKPLPVLRITMEDIQSMARVSQEVRTDYTGRTGKVQPQGYQPARVYHDPGFSRE